MNWRWSIWIYHEELEWYCFNPSIENEEEAFKLFFYVTMYYGFVEIKFNGLQIAIYHNPLYLNPYALAQGSGPL